MNPRSLVLIASNILLLPLISFVQERTFSENGRRDIGVCFAQTRFEVSEQDSVEIQDLLAKLRSDDDAKRYEALQALSKFGQSIVPAVNEALRKESGYAKIYAARVLLNVEAENQLALKTLAEIARSKPERKDVRRYASYVMALSRLGIGTLAGMLKDEDVFVRRSAAFALEEAIENGDYLPPNLEQPLYDALPALALVLADDDKIVSGVSAEAFEQILNKDIPALDEAAKSSDAKLRKAAAEVIKRRKSIDKIEGYEAEAKPEFDEYIEKKTEFLRGNLGLLRALRIGGEPVRDYRSIVGSFSGKDNPRSLRVVFKSSTRKLSIRSNRFNPYEDLK